MDQIYHFLKYVINQNQVILFILYQNFIGWNNLVLLIKKKNIAQPILHNQNQNNPTMKEQRQEIQLESLQRFNENKSAAQLYLQERIKAPHKTHNAYTNDKSFSQIITALLFILQITLHSIFVAPYVYKINNQILNFFFILNYFIMCAVIGHYVYLTISDPVDSLIVDMNQKQTVQKNSKQETVFCVMCQKTVKKTSKHCYDCGRCTEQYDHHCPCLNNCIGLGNYQQFIRLLLFYQIFNCFMTLQAIWVITRTDVDHGGNIFLIILSMSMFALVILLLVFHCYLNCFIKKPTFQFFKDRKHRKYEVGDKVEYKNYLGEVLGMVLKQKKLNLQKQRSLRDNTPILNH